MVDWNLEIALVIDFVLTGEINDMDVTSEGNGLFQCRFYPEADGIWKVDLHYGNTAVTER